jgi:hypothetical protein
MSTIGIVVLSVIGGLFLALIAGIGGALIYLFFRARTILADFHTALKNDFAIIRTQLELQQQQIVTAIQKINGEELSQAAAAILKAAQSNVQSAQRIERAAIVIGELIIPAEVKRDHGLAPEEFATPEPGERFITSNRTAALDQAAEAEEGRSVTEGF